MRRYLLVSRSHRGKLRPHLILFAVLIPTVYFVASVAYGHIDRFQRSTPGLELPVVWFDALRPATGLSSSGAYGLLPGQPKG